MSERTINALTIIHSSNAGWRTFDREARAGISPELIESHHVTLDEPLLVRAFGLRPPGAWGRETQRVRKMQAWGRAGQLSDALPAPSDRDQAALIVTQRRALSLARTSDRRNGLIATLGDAVAPQFEQEFGMPAAHARRLAELERRVYEHTDVGLFLSSWAADAADASYGSTGCRFAVFPPTIADPFPDGPPRRCREEQRLLFVGNDFLRKGGDLLLDLFERRRVPGAELVVASAAPPPTSLPDGVTWLGAVPRDRVLSELMTSSDLLVLPTRRDMSPWVVVEALAAGLPVVASASGAIPEMIEDGGNGVLLDDLEPSTIADALNDALRDQAFLDAAGRAGRARFERHHSSTTGWVSLIDELEAAR